LIYQTGLPGLACLTGLPGFSDGLHPAGVFRAANNEKYNSPGALHDSSLEGSQTVGVAQSDTDGKTHPPTIFRISPLGAGVKIRKIVTR